MKIFFDHRILRVVKHDKKGGLAKTICAVAREKGILIAGKPLAVHLDWASLLEVLDCGSLLESFPKFDENSPLFNILSEVLAKCMKKDLVIQLFDRVFAECLTQVKALPEINAAFLLQQIEKRQKDQEADELSFAASLEKWKIYLTDRPKEAMHDLILYLGFDRVCAYLAVIFEKPFSEEKAQNGLSTLKECLLESFQHITGQGRTAPGFFRMCETLYAYEMREEHLQGHTDAEWSILCQGIHALSSREALSDLSHIDEALQNTEEPASLERMEALNFVTSDPVEVVQAQVALTNYMIEKIKRADPAWKYRLSPVNVIIIPLTPA